MEFDFRFNQPQPTRPAHRMNDAPMRILVMGDFGGRATRGLDNIAELRRRRTVAVDVDNFDQVLFRYAPRAELGTEGALGPAVALQFHRLDDFHPDSLYRRAEVFGALSDLRARLQDPATFAQAAAALGHQITAQAHEDEGPVETENEATTLERLLGARPASAPRRPRDFEGQATEVQALVKRIVAPYIVPDAPPFQAQYLASVEMAVNEQMRAILHHPVFQGLESIWRSIHWLVVNLELSEQLQLHLLDVTKDELLADTQAAGESLGQSALYRLLVEQDIRAPGSEPWSLLVGHYAFGTGAEDVALLAALGAIASQAGGPLVAAADASVLGCRSMVATPDPRDWQLKDSEAEQRWTALRRSSVASWIGLALPRVLLRLPYGKGTDPIEQFAFEELAPVRDHDAYLWGNSAIACALLIGQAFVAGGWDAQPGDRLDIVDLPAHTFEQDGERHLQACAEIHMGERAGEAILSRGLMPLLSYRNRNAIRVMRFQSVAEPAAALSGPWQAAA